LILATGHVNGAVKLWDLRTQKLAFELKSDLVEEVTSLNFSLKGSLLAATSKDNVATRLLNIKKQNEQSLILEHGGKTNFTAFDQSGTYIATAFENGIDIYGYKKQDAPIVTLENSNSQTL